MMRGLSVPQRGGKQLAAVVDHSNIRAEFLDPHRWARRAADLLATGITTAIGHRGHCLVALSGGSTPAPVFEMLAQRALPWSQVTFTQVDERLAPLGAPERNLTAQLEALGNLPARWIPLPIDDPASAPDSDALDEFIHELEALTGRPLAIDVMHLGLGDDGHTASLVPGDPIVDETDRLVGVTDDYRGSRRITLTRPAIDRAGLAVWVVAGANKAGPIAQLMAGDPTIPAGLVRPHESVIVADVDAKPAFETGALS